MPPRCQLGESISGPGLRRPMLFRHSLRFVTDDTPIALAQYLAQRLAAQGATRDVVLRPPPAEARAVAIAPVIEHDTALPIKPVLGPREQRIELDLAKVGWLGFAALLGELYDRLAPVLGPCDAMIVVAAVGYTCIRTVTDNQ